MNARKAFGFICAVVSLALGLSVPSIAYGQEMEIGFAYIDHAQLSVGETQQVAIVAEGGEPLTGATLTYAIGNDEQAIEATTIREASALFEIRVNQSGNYTLRHVTFITESKSYDVPLCDEDTEEVVFRVVDNDARGLLNTAQAVDSDSSGTSFYTLDENGSITTSADAAQNVLERAAYEQDERSMGVRTLSKGDFVVALDPGHGGSSPGAVSFGLKEKDLTLAIAKYCQAELGEYRSVRTYMTRSGDVTMDSLEERVVNSINNGADVIVSVHINSGGGSGAEVWYPNDSSWKNDATHGQGEVLAQKIQDELAALGLNDRGIKMRDYGTGGTYEDGSMADYYGILREARKRGVPAIIVEHAFIDNSSDAQKLASDSWLKKMGRADAHGIAKTYGLAKHGDAVWRQSNGMWQYHLNGELQTGWFLAGGSWYYADKSGNCLTGWQRIAGKWYYLDPANAFMHRGWLTLSGKTYHLAYSGAMNVSWTDIDGRRYYFLADGAMATGVQVIDGEIWRFTDKGTLLTGWVFENGTWFYFRNGQICKGWIKVGGAWYYMKDDGSMATGWLNDRGTWFYLNKSGSMATGWLNDRGTWFLLGGSGEMLTGWQKSGGKWYYLSSSGAMKTGWLNDRGTWFYLNKSGAMTTGWLELGDTWYYLQSSGAMTVGWKRIGGIWFLFNKSGAMATGWGFDGRAWSKFASNGAWQGYGNGWQLIEGKWRYLTNGVSATGWKRTGGSWYLFDPQGIMLTGWQKVGTEWYYLLDSGRMTTGWLLISDSYEYFSTGTGAWVPEKTQKMMPVLSKAKADDGLIGSMVSAFSSSGAAYPSSQLSKGGAPTLESFCSILFEEAAAEGVDPRVLFCQAMLETGWLKFGGTVKPSQYNFGGIGATDDGGKPASFKDVRTGLRAQVQHLKAYADANPKLANPCVDPRFDLVSKGSAEFVQHLGIQENPQHLGWASTRYYGITIVDMIRTFF